MPAGCPRLGFSRKAPHPKCLWKRLVWAWDPWGFQLKLGSNYRRRARTPFLLASGCPAACYRLASGPPPLQDLEGRDPSHEVTWKEVKESSVSSLTKRRVPRACSSITKAKMTSWVPSRGMSVSVDLASLGGVGWRCHWGPLP